MKFLRYSLLALLLGTSVFGSSAFADDDMGFGPATVRVDPKAYGIETFWCNSRTYYSDIDLPKFHGCDAEPVNYGRNGAPATLVTAYYDWEEGGDETHHPKRAMFIEMPDGVLYRLADTRFLTHPRIDEYFRNIVGFPPKKMGETNINLRRFAQMHMQNYANTFCVEYHLKHPFKGLFGWCQNDTIVDGEGHYLDGAMTFTRATLLAQNYIYDNRVRVKNNMLLGPETMTAINTDPNGWIYYAFGVPAQAEKRYVGAYSFRVYFNGHVELREYQKLPEDPGDL